MPLVSLVPLVPLVSLGPFGASGAHGGIGAPGIIGALGASGAPGVVGASGALGAPGHDRWSLCTYYYDHNIMHIYTHEVQSTTPDPHNMYSYHYSRSFYCT